MKISFAAMGYYDTYLLQNFEAKIREAEGKAYSLIKKQVFLPVISFCN